MAATRPITLASCLGLRTPSNRCAPASTDPCVSRARLRSRTLVLYGQSIVYFSRWLAEQDQPADLGRAPPAGSVGRDPQYGQHPVRRQRRHRRRPHRRGDRLERPGILGFYDASPVGRRLAGARGVARAYPARKLLLCQAATGFTASAGSPRAFLRYCVGRHRAAD
jgi:hypothetical protein